MKVCSKCGYEVEKGSQSGICSPCRKVEGRIAGLLSKKRNNSKLNKSAKKYVKESWRDYKK